MPSLFVFYKVIARSHGKLDSIFCTETLITVLCHELERRRKDGCDIDRQDRLREKCDEGENLQKPLSQQGCLTSRSGRAAFEGLLSTTRNWFRSNDLKRLER